MLNVDIFLKNLKYLVMKRITKYNNKFPFNCGYLDLDNIISCDCIGMIKSEINYPDFVYVTGQPGFYVRPGQNIPDSFSEADILNSCENVRWGNFEDITPGAYLYMPDHGGIYMGEYGDVNTVECCVDWGKSCCVFSYTDPKTGVRYDRKGGTQSLSWQANGLLKRFINYDVWQKDGKDWYYGTFPRWIKDNNYNGKWFCVGAGGKIRIGWFYDDYYKRWFYLQPKNDGKHYTGEMRTGWVYDPNHSGWFYLQPQNDGKHYTGEMRTGWIQHKNKWYYLGSDGKMLTGWQKIGDYWYYFIPNSGEMVTGDYAISGKIYHFDEKGHWVNG